MTDAGQNLFPDLRSAMEQYDIAVKDCESARHGPPYQQARAQLQLATQRLAREARKVAGVPDPTPPITAHDGLYHVFGYSDDLIEIEPVADDPFPFMQIEVAATEDGVPNIIEFPDGTMISALFNDDGKWDIIATRQGPKYVSRTEGKVTEDVDDYSDRVLMKGPLEGVKINGKLHGRAWEGILL